jgi:tRNA nucleotidyltransferase (CCA-adding enzyme)
VRNFLGLYGNALKISSLKQINMENISELIIVDTRQKDRIGVFESLLNNKKIKVVVYDHHPPMDNDIRANVSTIKQLGATTTILLKKLIEKNIPITPL